MLHQLPKSSGYIKKSIQRGRGNASGRGNYSTKGLKGAQARTGYSTQPGFEGGQTPLHMRLPKARGFKRHVKHMKKVSPVNLSAIQADDRFVSGSDLSLQLFYELGYAHGGYIVKVLGDGECTKSFVCASNVLFSQSARVALEKNGSTFAQ